MLRNLGRSSSVYFRILEAHKSSLKKLPQIETEKCCVSYSTAAVPSKTTDDKWDLFAGVLVERLPVISQNLNELEQEFQNLLLRIEYENSLKSDHELKHEKDLIQAELIKKGKMELDLDDTSSKQTAQDLKDAYKEELKAFKTAQLQTVDDAKKNKTSTNRCLDDTLYLLIEQKRGDKLHFLLPQGIRLEGESMRQTAERVLLEKCGDSLKVDFYGHAPCGVYKYKYPSALRTTSVGAKIFFYRAILREGNCNKSISKNYEWLPRSLLNTKLNNASYAESVQKFLF